MFEILTGQTPALPFQLSESGLTIADISVTLSLTGGTPWTGAGTVAEIGNSLYSYQPTISETAYEGMLTLVPAVDGTDETDYAMAYMVVAYTRENLADLINNVKGAVQARPEPLNSTETQAAAAAALVAYDPPTRAEATADKEEILAPIAAADQLIIASLYEASESPSIVLPAPSDDADLCVCYDDAETGDGVAVDGEEVTFRLMTKLPHTTLSGRSLSKKPIKATFAAGRLTVSLEKGTRWLAENTNIYGSSGKIVEVPTDADIYDINPTNS